MGLELLELLELSRSHFLGGLGAENPTKSMGLLYIYTYSTFALKINKMKGKYTIH